MISASQKQLLIGVVLAFVIALQFTGRIKGLTDRAAESENIPIYLGAGAVIGFVFGLATLNRSGDNPMTLSVFFAVLLAAIAVLTVNAYRGFVAADFGLNTVAVVALPVVPMLFVGGYVRKLIIGEK